MPPGLESMAANWEDTFLALRLRAGSASALARIYEKHRHTLLKVASGLLADRAEAEDIVQEVFLRIAREPRLVRRNGNLRAFLCTCVANRARNSNRSGRVRAADAEADPDTLSCPASGPTSWLLLNDRIDALNRALALLPAEQREVVVLHLQGGMRFREIATATAVSINTVQSRYRYGLERLRNEMKEEN